MHFKYWKKFSKQDAFVTFLNITQCVMLQLVEMELIFNYFVS